MTALVLPVAGASASTDAEATGVTTTTLLPVTEELLFHFDAANTTSYSGSGATVYDAEGGGNRGVIGSGVTHVPASAGTPAHFSLVGPTSAISAQTSGGSSLLTGSSPTAYTKMIWFRRDADNAFHNMFSSQSTSGQAQHFLFFSSSSGDPYKRTTAGNGTSYTRITTTLTVNVGAWTFAAVTFSTATGFALYTNQNDRTWTGAEHVATAAYNAGSDALNGALGFQIGAYGGTNGLAGDIATAIAYSTALTEAQVKAYYAATVDRFYPAG